MDKAWICLLAICITVFAGCANPLKRFNKSQAKVDQAKVAIAENKTDQQNVGRDFTYAANQALRLDKSPSKECELATDMTDRALGAMGLPPAEEALALRQMVHDLVSTNEAELARGQKALSDKDAELIKIQAQADKLGGQLDQAELKLRAVSQDNAILAGKWTRLKHILDWVIGGVVLLVVLWLASIFLPIFFPELGAARSALHGVVSAVEAVRTKIAATHPELAKEVDATLAVAAPPNSRAAATIGKVKAALGL